MRKIKDRQNQKNDLDAKITMRINMEEKNLFKSEEQRRLRVKNGNKIIIFLFLFLILFIFLSILFVNDIRTNYYSLAWVIKSAGYTLRDFYCWITGSGLKNNIDFTFYRYLIVAIVGAALSTSGAVYQGSFKNAMASPTTLGVQAGGMFAASLYVIFFIKEGTATGIYYFEDYMKVWENMNIFERNIQQLVVLAGCFLGVFLIITIARIAGRGKISSVALILTGMVFSSLISTFSGLAMYYLALTDLSGTKISALRYIMMGSFDNTYSLQHLGLVGIPILICLFIVILMRAKINVLVFGEDEARSMGIKVDLLRNTLVAICTIMTAVVISFCGQIGFIGLIVPHITRFIVGPNFDRLIPASAVMGGIVMVAVYDVAYSLEMSSSINLFTNVIGGTLFAFIMLAYRRKRNADWS